MDYFAQHMHNCDLVNLEDMLQNGTVISGTLIEKPKSFSTACNIATQIIAQVASSQYGGQSITLTHLAPFVQVSREKITKEVEEELEYSAINGYIDTNGNVHNSSVAFYTRPMSFVKNAVIHYVMEVQGATAIARYEDGRYIPLLTSGSQRQTIEGDFICPTDGLYVFCAFNGTMRLSITTKKIGSIEELIKELRKAANGEVTRLPRIEVVSKKIVVNGNDIIGLNTSKNEVDCTICYVNNGTKIEESGIIAYQGNSSLRAPKKGFTLGFASKHRFKNWIMMDEYHCKGYYTDWMHARDLVCNQIYEQMMNSRSFDCSRPWKKYNDFGANSNYNFIEDGALAHIDGFPVELYINGYFWGLYSLNIKKERANYCLDKANVNHIMIDPDGATLGKSSPNWAGIEIRNPKKDDGNTEFIEGAEPNEGSVKSAILDFNRRLNSITDSTTKDELSGFLNITELIDTILLCQFANIWDSFGKNTLFTTWDSTHWSPLMYDLDLSFGIGYAGGSSVPEGEIEWSYNYNTFGQKAYSHCPWLSIVESILSSEIENYFFDEYYETITHNTLDIVNTDKDTKTKYLFR